MFNQTLASKWPRHTLSPFPPSPLPFSPILLTPDIDTMHYFHLGVLAIEPSVLVSNPACASALPRPAAHNHFDFDVDTFPPASYLYGTLAPNALGYGGTAPDELECFVPLSLIYRDALSVFDVYRPGAGGWASTTNWRRSRAP